MLWLSSNSFSPHTSDSHFFIFFFKYSGPPRILPSSPPRPSPDPADPPERGAGAALPERRYDRRGVRVPRRLARRDIDTWAPPGAHGRAVARGEAWTASQT